MEGKKHGTVKNLVAHLDLSDTNIIQIIKKALVEQGYDLKIEVRLDNNRMFSSVGITVWEIDNINY